MSTSTTTTITPPFVSPITGKLNSITGGTTPSNATPFNPANNRNTTRATWENWAATNRCIPSYFHTPRTVEEIQAVLRLANERREQVRVVGYGHSPGHIALTDGHMIALGVHFTRVIGIDRERMRATVESGISLEKLNSALDAVGLALPSLGSISDQTLGGALACGTHGTSALTPSVLSAFVVEFELLDASGVTHLCNAERNVDLFNAGRISLGALGILTRVTIQCEAAYDLRETTISIPFNDLVNPDKFRSMLNDPATDFLRFHWIPHTESVVYTRMKKVYNQPNERDSVKKSVAAASSPLVKQVQRIRDWKDRFIGFHALQAAYYCSTFGNMDRVLVPRIAQLYSKLIFPPVTNPTSSPSTTTSTCPSSSIVTRQDRHDRILNFDCLFKQYVTEWAIDQQYTVEALKAVRTYIETEQLVVHFPIEIRFGGVPKTGDGIWLSPCYSTPQTWIGIIMYRPYGKDVEFKRYFEGFERILNDSYLKQQSATPSTSSTTASASSTQSSGPVRYLGKPHWAKNVVMPLNEIPFTDRYPRWKDFLQLRQQLDPTGLFMNEYLKQLIQATETSTTQGKKPQPIKLQSKL